MSYSDKRDRTSLECKVYVGNLGSGASRNELEKEFGHFGRLSNVWVARNPPGFAYIEFHDSRDAKDAVRNLDGEMLCGRRAKVEISHGKQRNRSFRPSFSDRDRSHRRPNMSEIRCYSCNDYGHFSRDCDRERRSRSRSRSPRRRRKSRSESRDRSHSKSRSKSRSHSPDKRERSRTPDKRERSCTPVKREHSRTPVKRERSRTPDKRERSRSRSHSSKRKSRSKSSEVNRSYSHSRSRSSSR